jgi:tRNA threonylcarbamoyladenosine biosynthesis protein TsaB
MADDRRLLVLDTATRTPVLALATQEGRVVAERRWESQHRHGELLLEQLDHLLEAAGALAREIKGIVVGTGPGSFTGLRIGLATAKVLAYSLEVPLVGISTMRALAVAAADDTEGALEVAVTLPAGVADRYVARVRVSSKGPEERGAPALTARPEDFAEAARGAMLVAVDLSATDIPAEAVGRGRHALTRLAQALAAEGAAALADGRRDDIYGLVPAYVALPRGVASAAEEMTWSPDLR